jgi:pSer/pThr/pTyr-binding forkhead associated (FHA) protein
VVQGFGIVCSQCRRLNAEKSAACENCQKPLTDAKLPVVAASRPAARPIGAPPKPLTTIPKPASAQSTTAPSKLPLVPKPLEAKSVSAKPAVSKSTQAPSEAPLETVRLQPDNAKPLQTSSAAHGRFSALLQAAKANGDFDDDLIGDWIQKRGVSENTVSSLDATPPGFLEAFQQEALEESKIINGPRENQLPIEPPMERRDQIICTNCGAIIHPGHKFCGKCGTSIEEITAKRPPTDLFGPLQQVGKAKLVLIKGEGLDGISYQLNAREHIAGRSQGAILFPDDPFLSPRHANFFYREGRLFIRDEGGLNGVYLRLREPTPLTSGDFFLCGEEIFRFEAMEPDDDVVAPDGTYYFSSPKRRNYFRLVQVLVGGREGLRYHAKRKSLIIGRERCDLNFPLDRFISGSHSKVEMSDTGFKLSDMGSRNGTFIRIHSETELTHGDYVFLGQQLLRVEITER